MSSTYEAQLTSTSYSAEISWLEYEIRHAQKQYYLITKRGPLSENDCVELDAIDAFIRTKKWEIRQMVAEAEAKYRKH